MRESTQDSESGQVAGNREVSPAASDDASGAEPRPFDARRRPGDFLFAAASFALALFLLIALPEQTRWFDRVDLLLQPRFWPALILGAFALCSGLHLMQSALARRAPNSLDTSPVPACELLRWLRPLEFALYFVLYAASIPWLGYLLSTLLFMPLLGLRTGIRSLSGLGLLAGIGAGIVLVFKTGLEVRMPPGAVYELFPPAARNFLIRNF